MNAIYNEIEPYAAEWMRNLVQAKHITDGRVDERSIRDLAPADVRGYTQAHFFAGLGGWSYALKLAGWPDDLPVWTGSCPCQPFSQGGKGKGFDDERHLWPDWLRLIKECHPPIIFGEQVASHEGYKWLDKVSSDLENENYAFAAADLCASVIGAKQIRKRLFFVATSDENRQLRPRVSSIRRKNLSSLARCNYSGTWAALPVPRNAKSQPSLLLSTDGLSTRVERISAYGNAIVPQVAATFIKAVMEIL